MTTTLLPSAIKASNKTISADSITSLSKSSSTLEKLESIRKFLTLDFKRDRSSFIMKRRQRQEEKKRLREENLEKKKESKFSLPSVNISNPFQDIFSSIGNFFLFLGGGLLFNRFLDLEKGLMGVAKLIEGIGKGIDFVVSMVGSLTNFVDSTVKGYDNFTKKFEDITGVKQEDVDKFLKDFKMVINGGVIAALIGLRSLPAILRARSRVTGGSGGRPRITRGSRISRSLSRSGRSRVTSSGLSGKFARSAVTNTARKGVVAVLGKRGVKGLLQFSKRFISPILQKIPIIGTVVDFLLNYFVFKEPLGRSAFRAIGAGLFASLGAAIGGPFAIFTGIGGATLGDFLGGKLADAILGDPSVDISGIDQYADYAQNFEITNNIIQPIES